MPVPISRHEAHARPDRGQARGAQASRSRSCARSQPASHVTLGRVRLRLHRGEPLDPRRASRCSSARRSATSSTPATSSSTRRRSTAALTDYGALAHGSAKSGVAAADVRLHQRRDARVHALRAEVGEALRRDHRERRPARHRRLVREPHPPRPAGLRRGRRRGPQGRRHRPLDGQRTSKIARDLGYLISPTTNIVDAFDVEDLPAARRRRALDRQPGRAALGLARMANGDHRTVDVERGDTVVISASRSPATRRPSAASSTASQGRRRRLPQEHRATSTSRATRPARSSSSCSTCASPRTSCRSTARRGTSSAHARLAEAVGMYARERLRHRQRRLPRARRGRRARRRARRAASSTSTASSVGDVGQVVLRDRQLLASDGIATDRHRHRRADRQAVIGEPELVMRGIVFGPTRTRCSWRRRGRASPRRSPRPPGKARPTRVSSRTPCASRCRSSVGANPPPADDHSRRHGGLGCDHLWAIDPRRRRKGLPSSCRSRPRHISSSSRGSWASRPRSRCWRRRVRHRAARRQLVAILLALWPDWVTVLGRLSRRCAGMRAPDDRFQLRFVGFLLLTSVPGAIAGVLLEAPLEKYADGASSTTRR